jgi:hypothetical protein
MFDLGIYLTSSSSSKAVGRPRAPAAGRDSFWLAMGDNRKYLRETMFPQGRYDLCPKHG